MLDSQGTTSPTPQIGGSRYTTWRRRLVYLGRHGPFAMAASSLPGVVNYGILLYLAYASSVHDAGVYRLMIAYFTLLGLAVLLESAKLIIRASAAGDTAALGRLLVARMTFSMLAFIVIATAHGGAGLIGIKIMPADLVWLAAIAFFYYPADMYRSVLQAERRFLTLFITDAVKYGFAFAGFVAAMWSGTSIGMATFAYLLALTVFQLVSAAWWLRGKIKLPPLRSLWNAVYSREINEAFGLSVANLLPNSLADVDKMIVGHVFGLHVLGIYSIGFSTGRFIYNSLKPSLCIYYTHFVERLPSRAALAGIFFVFSMFGVAMSAMTMFAVRTIPQFERLQSSEAVSIVMFMFYGIAMADAVYVQAYMINRHTRSWHVMVANLVGSVPCVVLFGVATYFPPPVALVLFAAHFGVRHLVAFVTLCFLHAWSNADRSAAREPGLSVSVGSPK